MQTDLGIDKIYIVHAVTGYELQEQRLRELFAKFGITNYEFITDGDTRFITREMLDKYFCQDIAERLRPGVLSCTLNHILCYERIVASGNEYALVFENDPYFLGNFTKKIKHVVREADTLKHGFLISLENTTFRFPSSLTTKRNKYLYPASYGRAAGAYMIDLAGAKQILNDLQKNKCCQVIDWWHNTLIKNKVVNMYWAHPPLTEQGSHNGKMQSVISTKNKSIARRISWILQKYYRTYIRRIFKNDAY